jgi:hypothetical protein
MAKASWTQLQELGLRIRRGQIPEWKIPAVFGIVEPDALGTYLRFVEEARKEIISAEQVQALMEGNDETLGIFKVTVDYGLTLEQMVAVGYYDMGHSDITSEHFPISGTGKVVREVVLVRLNRRVTTDEVFIEIDRRGLRPAKAEDGLALGAAYPELQRGSIIVALGSAWMVLPGSSSLVFDQVGRHLFVCVGPLGSGRCLGLGCSGDQWGGVYRFLAVRKDAT